MNPEITVIIPAKDEEESLSELCQWISRVMLAHGFSYEVIFVDDGSTDNTWQEIQKINEVDSRFKGIRFNQKLWKICSAANRVSRSPGTCCNYHGRGLAR